MKLTRMNISSRPARPGTGVHPTVMHTARGGKRKPGSAVPFPVPGRRLALAVILGGCAVPAVAADGVWHVGPVPAVRAICHAGDSLYVGTAAGLFIVDIRDPSRVTRVTVGAQLPSNSVRAIAARGDSVFVGTDAGLSLLRGARTTVFDARVRGAQGAAPVRDIQDLAFGARGEVLVATRGAGVGVLTRSGGHAITHRDSLLDDEVFGILERPGRPRLYATAAGLCAQADDTTFVSFQAGAGIPRGAVRQVVGDGVTAYLRVARRGVYRFDGMKASAIAAPAGIPLDEAASISCGADGALWAAGHGWVGVARGGRWARAGLPADDAALDWRVVVADGAGAFAGSADGVVLAVDRGAPMRVSLGAGLPAPAVTSIAADGRGGAWLVCGGRVLRADAVSAQLAAENSPLDAQAVEISPAGDVLVVGRWTVSRRVESGWLDLLPSVTETDPCFTSVSAESDGLLWVGASSGSLYRYDGETWVRYARSRTPGGSIRDTRPYRDDSWALLAGTPAVEASGSWRGFAGWDSTAVATDLARGPRGEWVVATARGLFAYDAMKRELRPVTARAVVRGAGADGGADPTAGRRVTAVAFDASGRLYIGTEDGVVWVDRDREGWLGARDGLGGVEVTELAVDDRYLWVGFARDGFSAVPRAEMR
jgi:ligand-binding sensor domain-containing protein